MVAKVKELIDSVRQLDDEQFDVFARQYDALLDERLKQLRQAANAQLVTEGITEDEFDRRVDDAIAEHRYGKRA